MTAATAPTGQLAPTISLGTRLAGFSHLLAPGLAARPHPHPEQRARARGAGRGVGAGDPRALPRPTRRPPPGLAGVLSNPSVIALYGPVAAHTADALAVFKTLMMGAFLTAVLGLRRGATAHPHRGGRGAPRAARRRRRRPLVGARRRRDAGDDRRRRRQRALRRGARRPRHGRHREHRVRDRLDDGRPRHDRSQRRRRAARLDHARRRRARLRLPRRDVRAAGRRRLRRPRHVRPRPRLAVTAGLDRSGRGLRRRTAPGSSCSACSPSSCGVAVALAVLDRRDLGAGVIPARSGPRRAGPPARRTAVARHQAGPRHDHRLDGRHGPRRCRRGVAARLGGRHGLRPRHPGPAREAGRHHRLGRGRLRRHRDPLRRRRPSPLPGIALVLRLVGSERSGLGEVVLVDPDQPGPVVRRPRRCSRSLLTTALHGAARRRRRAGRPLGQRRRPRRSARRSAPPWPRSPRSG